MDSMVERYKVEEKEDWRGWINKIPAIKFMADWSVKVIPPFSGAIARFQVTSPCGERTVSVYLDCYDRIGCFGEPYWELYPYNDDVYRVKMADVEELVQRIEESFNQDV